MKLNIVLAARNNFSGGANEARMPTNHIGIPGNGLELACN